MAPLAASFALKRVREMCARSRRCLHEGGGPARAPCLALLHVGSQAGDRAAPTTPGEEVVEKKKGEEKGRVG